MTSGGWIRGKQWAPGGYGRRSRDWFCSSKVIWLIWSKGVANLSLLNIMFHQMFCSNFCSLPINYLINADSVNFWKLVFDQKCSRTWNFWCFSPFLSIGSVLSVTNWKKVVNNLVRAELMGLGWKMALRKGVITGMAGMATAYGVQVRVSESASKVCLWKTRRKSTWNSLFRTFYLPNKANTLKCGRNVSKRKNFPAVTLFSVPEKGWGFWPQGGILPTARSLWGSQEAPPVDPVGLWQLRVRL